MTNDDERAGTTGEPLVAHHGFITGIAGHYYHAESPVVPGESVSLVREPDNPADRDAIAVLDRAGRKIGFLGRQIAAEYAPLIDHGFVRLSGRLLAPGEPGHDPDRAGVNPPLFVGVHVDFARIEECSSRSR